MKTLKVYLITASILLAGVGVASAKQGKEKAKKEETKAKSDKKGGGNKDIAVKKQGASSGSNAKQATAPGGNK